MSESVTPNRLIHEQSPYLRQHALNPVDWYPWGEDAFLRSTQEEKPIFLSIGYSTCHWCHVMERESFEDQEIAAYLKEHFISIKIDREERPDLDRIYMSAVQAMSGSGGWPMTLFLTPELKPFFGGTYFPPKSGYGRPAFRQLLERIVELWETDRPALIASSETLTQAIKESSHRAGTEVRGFQTWEMISDLGAQYFEQAFDKEEGGFGGAPKFPRPVQFDFLFNYFAMRGDEPARDMALFTLNKMAAGGIRDHLAGGFHRYSVDQHWRVSHFEKMLYDQAQLVHSYLDAFQITREALYSDVAAEIVRYVQREMTHPEGAFFSAEDADSEGEEGTFYVWTKEEIEGALGESDAKIAIHHFGITEEGNFEHGKNVLYLAKSAEEIAEETNQTVESTQESILRIRKKLFELRAKRVRPNLDDKILTSWNGLMIGAMARAGAVLGDQEFIRSAEQAAEFIWKALLETPGKLMHRWRENDVRYSGYLEDYAFLIHGFLELYSATFESIWLERAAQLQDEQIAVLFDETTGGFFMSEAAPDLIDRVKDDYDGAEPSGNSITVLNLTKLATMTGRKDYRDCAEKTLEYFHSRLSQHPYAMPELLVGAVRFERGSIQIVFAGGRDAVADFREEVLMSYQPDSILIYAEESAAIDPFYAALPAVENKGTAYLCRNFTCEIPVTSRDELRALLEKTSTASTQAVQ